MEERLFDYKGFWQDFTIAEKFGIDAIEDTFNRCKEWKDNPEYWGALVLTLNHKAWQHCEDKNMDVAELYDELWWQSQGHGYTHFKGADLTTFFNIVD